MRMKVLPLIKNKIQLIGITSLLITFLTITCTPSVPVSDTVNISPPVKSVMLYDSIYRWSLDTVAAALHRINRAVHIIDDQSGYTLWKIQEDTLSDYRILIEGSWTDQETFDLIHADSAFRKALDKDIHIFTETRKWDVYRRMERID